RFTVACRKTADDHPSRPASNAIITTPERFLGPLETALALQEVGFTPAEMLVPAMVDIREYFGIGACDHTHVFRHERKAKTECGVDSLDRTYITNSSNTEGCGCMFYKVKASGDRTRSRIHAAAVQN